MLIPNHLRYTSDHLWIEISGVIAKVGLTDYAQELLGTISFVELPVESSALTRQSRLATIEGLKSVIDIESPFTCTIVRVNQELKNDPKLINTSPYSDGWIAEVSFSDTGEIDGLLSAASYKALINR